MRLFNGQLGLFRRVFSNAGYSKQTFVLAALHWRWSITWRWSLYWTKSQRGCPFGSFEFLTQKNMKRT